MKKIQIIGTGCPKCKKLTESAETAAKELGINYEIEKITEASTPTTCPSEVRASTESSPTIAPS